MYSDCAFGIANIHLTLCLRTCTTNPSFRLARSRLLADHAAKHREDLRVGFFISGVSLCTGQFQHTVSADSMSRTKRIQDVCLEEHLGPNMAQLGTLFHPDIGSFHVRRFRPFGSLCHPGRVRRQVTFEFWSERVAHHCRREALTSRKRVARQLSLAAL